MPEQNKKKLLAGCVILYNPGWPVIKNVESYLPFLDVLYVIDNSNEVDNRLVNALCLLSSNIVYIPQLKNIGIASALNAAASLAVREEYSWLLTMDQDSRFIGEDFFNTWFLNLSSGSKIGLVTASYTNKYDRWQKDYSLLYNEIHFIVTSGNIINLASWSKVGGFEDKLFIDEVDHDYCLKLRRFDYKILISKQIYMAHMIGEFFQDNSNVLNNKNGVILHKPVRYYYVARNVLYLCKKYIFFDFRFVLARLWYLIKQPVRIILLYPDKSIYLKFFFRGIIDFVFSKYGEYQNDNHPFISR